MYNKLFTATILSLLLLAWLGVSMLAGYEIGVQAESGTITAPAEIFDDPLASGGKAIEVPAGVDEWGDLGGMADYQISIPEAGTYYIYGRVLTPSSGDNSFYVTWDAEEKGEVGGDKVWDIEPLQEGVWYWDVVALRENPDPTPFELTQGNHALKLLN